MMTEEQARGYPLALQIVIDRVKPERDANPREAYRRFWWRFGEPRRELREVLRGLSRYIVITYVAKHRVFSFLSAEMAPDDGLICFGSDDVFLLGCLSSTIHETWALAAGGVQEDRPRYNNTLCFDPFPHADPPPDLRARIGNKAEELDAHRKTAIARDESITTTKMQNVVEKLRSGAALTPKEQPGTPGLPEAEQKRAIVAAAEKLPWPGTAVAQLAALGALIARGPVSAEAAADAFTGASKKLVERHLETLALIGEASVDQAGEYGKAVRVG